MIEHSNDIHRSVLWHKNLGDASVGELICLMTQCTQILTGNIFEVGPLYDFNARSKDYARSMDREDQLRTLRDEFFIPEKASFGEKIG